MNTTELLLGWKRYEKIRKLSPAAFNRLHIVNVTGGGAFDDLIDALPEPTTPIPAPGRAPLTDEQIEAIATKTEDAGHGWAGDFKNISNHGFFEPDSLRAFVRAIESAHGIAPAGGIGGEIS